jgi:small subunit ribosomal protein S17
MPKKELIGKVVSDRMQKTVVVAVESLFAHPKYEKPSIRTKKFKAHDPENRCKMGDRVTLQECRPLSKTKRWIVTAVAKGEGVLEAINEGTEV